MNLTGMLKANFHVHQNMYAGLILKKIKKQVMRGLLFDFNRD